jgi:hypothetical protein
MAIVTRRSTTTSTSTPSSPHLSHELAGACLAELAVVAAALKPPPEATICTGLFAAVVQSKCMGEVRTRDTKPATYVPKQIHPPCMQVMMPW